MKRECPYCQTEQDVDPDLSMVFVTEHECEECGETFEYQTTENEASEIYGDSVYDSWKDEQMEREA